MCDKHVTSFLLTMSVEVTLEVKQKVFVSHVAANDGKFFVQLDTKEAYDLSSLSKSIQAHAESSSAEKIDPEYGLNCYACSNVDRTWYRALITAVNGSKVTVFYVDYGNTEEVPTSGLRAPRGQFFDSPYQSVCCRVANFIPRVAASKLTTSLLDLILENELYCSFLSESSTECHPYLSFLPCFNILLYKDEHNERTLAELLVERKLGQFAICAQSVAVGNKQNVYVSYVDSPGKFWVQLSKTAIVLQDLMDDLNDQKVVSSLKPLPPVAMNEGAVSCSQYAEDGLYYRAEIVQRTTSRVKIWFGDYGNTDFVPINKVFVLPPRLTLLPFCAVLCGLDSVLPVKPDKPDPKLGHIAWTSNASESFSNLTLNKEFEAQFVSELSPEVYTVNLTDIETRCDVRQTLADSGIVELVGSASFPQEELKEFEYLTLEVGQSYNKIFITHVESPGVVWCQRAEFLSDFEALASQLLAQAPTLPTLSNPEIGQSCCAQYSLDQSWCRGSIESVDQASQTVEVLFVDFGNTETVGLKVLKILPSEFFVLPAQAISFSMATISPRNSDSWTAEACEAFKGLVQEREFNCNVTQLDVDGYPSLTLFDPLQNEKDVGRELVHQGYAKCPLPTSQRDSALHVEDRSVTFVPSGLQPGLTSPRQAQSVTQKVLQYSTESLQSGRSYDVAVCYIQSLNEFYCQLLSNSNALDELMVKIDSHCTSQRALEVSPTVPGTPVFAKFSEDQAWYRAVSTGNADKGACCVKFVDYGNSETVSKSCLKQMSVEFIEFPAQAIQCSLYGLPRDVNPSTDILQSFIEMCLEQTCTMLVKQVSSDNVVAADLLSSDNSSISTQLVKLGLPLLKPLASVTSSPAKISIPFPSIKQKRPTNVVASYVESPVRFYLQMVEHCDALQSLLDELGSYYSNKAADNSQSFIPGGFCAARFSDDNVWYRARVTNVSGDQVEVEFIDYGNKEVTDVSTLRVLHPQFTAAPFMAVPCCLLGLSVADVMEDVCQRFSDLVLDNELSAEFLGSFSSFEDTVPVKLTDHTKPGQEADIANAIRGKSIVAKEHQSGTQFVKITPPLGTPITCLISYVANCGEFYCQLTSDSDQFNLFMDELYNYYGGEHSHAAPLGPVTADTYCAAPYSDDGSWYRALIRNATSNGATVFYIDFGNSELVPSSTLRKLDPKFFKASIQAIKCSLKEPAKLSSDEFTSDFRDNVLEQETTVTFVKLLPSGSYEANVQLHGSDVRQMLIERGAKINQGGVPAAVSPAIQIQTVSPVCNSPVQCTVSFINDCKEFYCQLASSSTSFTALMDDLYVYYSEQGKGTPLQSPTVGSYCAAPYTDGSWYRGLVTAVAEQEATVSYIDYGNTEVVPLAHLCNLDSSFCSIPIQGIKCSLSGLSTNSPQDCVVKFQEAVLEQEVQVVFLKSLPNGCNDVTLNHGGVDVAQMLVDAGVAMKESGSVTGPAELKCVAPVLSSPTQCTVTFITEQGEFYCQLASSSTSFTALMDDLYVYYSEQGKGTPLQSPTVGSYCAAPYTDGSWYRGLVTAVDEKLVTVSYMDYGNTEVVPLAHLCNLDPSFCSIPIQGIKCSLGDLPGGWSEESTQLWQESVLEQEVKVNFLKERPDGSYGASVLKDGVDIGQKLFGKMVMPPLSTPTSRNNQSEITVIQTTTPVLQTPTRCSISYIASCEEFYSQLLSESVQFDNLMNDLYAYYGGGGTSTPLSTPAVGSYCAAPYNDDGSWYRGVITDATPQSATVFYMDYGNTGEVKSSDLRKLESQFFRLPIQALLCCIDDVTPSNSENCTKTFQNAVLEKEVEVTFVNQLPHGTYATQLMVDGVSVSDILLGAGVAKELAASSTADPVIHVPPVIPVCGPPLKCFITHVVSCGEFYCQLSSEGGTFDAFMNKLYAYYGESGEGKPLHSPAIGTLCAALFTDGSWYRGRITALAPSGAEVLYLDYGNSDTVVVSELRELEPQFSGVPIQALMCHLKGLSPLSDNWSSECTARFQELVLENEVMVAFENQQPSESYPVTLTVAGQDISQILTESRVAKLSNEPSSKGMNTLSVKPGVLLIPPFPLEAGATCEVFVTSVNSSSEFYCQVLDPEEKLDSLMIDIGTFCVNLPSSSSSDSWCEGEFVFARFTEDHTWYRARILNISEDNPTTVNVRYVDYGNSEMLQSDELRKMIPRFSRLPRQAIKCSLEGAQHYSYNKQSHEQWTELLLNQEMELKCVSVLPDATCFVDLTRKDDGVDIMSTAIQQKIISARIVDPTVLPVEQNIQASPSQADPSGVRVACVFPTEVHPDSYHDVFVHHVETPSLFYCQFGQFHVNQLESVMSVMQDLYTSSGKSFQPVFKTKCTKGCFLAAQYSEDELWYRAQVEEVKADGVEVRFIDYGNTETVPFEKLRYLDEEFTKLPAQGVPCSLAEISPKAAVGSNWNSEVSETFGELVYDKRSIGQVKSIEDMSGKPFKFENQQTLEIILIDASNDSEISVGDELVRLGFADATTESQSPEHPLFAATLKTQNSQVDSSREKLLTFSNFLPVSVGEVHEMYVSHAISPASFWLQMPAADDILAVLQSGLTDVYGETQGVVLTKIQVGDACCTQFSEDGGWYRATVIALSSSNVTVRFLDYGNSEVVDASEVFVLQPDFFSTPVQAIECSLANLSPIGATYTEDALSNLSKLILDKPLSVTFRNKLEVNKWEVDLQGDDCDIAKSLVSLGSVTWKTSSANSYKISQPTIEVPSLDIQVGRTHLVYIAFSDSPSKFFCQLVSECDKLEALMAEVADYYSGHQLDLILEVGSFCVAQYSGNSAWYRGLITGIDSSGSVEVNFIDYGNSEYVSPDQVFGLESQFAVLPAQGISCSIVQDLNMEFSSELIQQFFQYDLDQEFKVKIRAVQGKRYVVDLYDQQGCHVNASLLKLIPPAPEKGVRATENQTYTPLVFGVGTSVDAYISFTNSPTSFYCQPLELAAELDNMMNEIATLMSSSPAKVMAPASLSLGKICLAQYSEDNEWYRAIVTEVVKEDSVSVRFVDYGNAETTTPSHITDLPVQFLSCSIQAIHCSAFEGLEPGMKWQEDQVIQFQELVSQNDHLTMKITDVPSPSQYCVELSTNGDTIDFSSLLEQLMERAPQNSTEVEPSSEHHVSLEPVHVEPSGVAMTKLFTIAAKGSATSSNALGSESGETDTDNGSAGEPLIQAPFKLSLAVQEVLDVNVVYVQSPSLVYIQRADCQTELDNLMEEIEQYCASFGEAQKEFPQTFHHGDHVLAKYSVDGAWYRAEVMGVDSEDRTTEVSFIDYGNVEILPPEELIMCPENLLELPAQAIPCSLSQVPRRDSWPFEYKEMLNGLVEGKVLKATVTLPGSQGMRPTVKLEDLLSNIDLSQQVLLKLQDECEIGSNDVIAELPEGEDLDDLKEEDLPTELQSETESQDSVEATTGVGNEQDVLEDIVETSLERNEETTTMPRQSSPTEPLVGSVHVLPERQLEVSSAHDVFVVSCDSPHSFICQLAAEAESLDTVTARLAQLYTSSSDKHLATVPVEDDIVAAQFSEDEQWYRGRVLSVQNGGQFEVVFIDYGNSEILSLDKMRQLDETLFAYPPLALECFLSGVEAPSVEGVFPVETADKINELIAEEMCCIEIVSIDTAGHLGVTMTTSNGTSVGSTLIEAKLASPLVPTPETLTSSLLSAADNSVAAGRDRLTDVPLQEYESEEPISESVSTDEERQVEHVPVSPEEVRVDVPPGDKSEVPEVDVLSTDQSEVPEVVVPPSEALDVDVPPSEVPDVDVPPTCSEVPEVDVPPSDKSEVPEVDVPPVDKSEVPEVDVPLTDTTEVPEVDVPSTDTSEVPDVDVPPSEVPDVDVPSTDKSEVPEVDVTPGDKSEVPEVYVPPSDKSEVPEVDVPPSDKSEVPEVDVPSTDKSEVHETVDQRVPDETTFQLADNTVAEDSVPSPADVSSPTSEHETIPSSKPLDQTVPGDDHSDDVDIGQGEDAITELKIDTVEQSLQPNEFPTSQATSSLSGDDGPAPDTSTTAKESTSVLYDESEKTVSSDDIVSVSQVNTNGNNNTDVYATSFRDQSLIPGNRYQVQALSSLSPDDFICQLVEQSDLLKQITQELEDINSELETLSLGNPAPGIPVCVYVDKDKVKVWKRAEILSLGRTLETIKVYYIDNGTVDIVPRERVKPLIKKFSDLLPPQAVRCQLPVLCETDLNPNLVLQDDPWELTWPSSCVHHLTELTVKAGNGLYLEILAANKDGNHMYVVKVLDCSAEVEVDLRSILVEKLRAPNQAAVTSPSLPIEHQQLFEGALTASDLREDTASECVCEVTVGVESVTLHAQTPPPSSEDDHLETKVLKSSSSQDSQLKDGVADSSSCQNDQLDDEVTHSLSGQDDHPEVGVVGSSSCPEPLSTEPQPSEALPSETLAAIPPDVPPASQEDSDFVDGDMSVSTGEGDSVVTSKSDVLVTDDGVHPEGAAATEGDVNETASTVVRGGSALPGDKAEMDEGGESIVYCTVLPMPLCLFHLMW